MAERARAAAVPDPGPFAPGTDDPHLISPLGALAGNIPDAPFWFQQAISAPFERRMVQVEGADVEWLCWGEAGKPGLLFLHGNAANADWWRFTAPFFAKTHRVAALSWSGMGGSQHRPAYSADLMQREIAAVADAAGLGARFSIVAHSFGGRIAMLFARQFPERIEQAIIIDTPFYDKVSIDRSQPPRPHRIYPTKAAALARFRWAPVQPSDLLYTTDFIARSSLKAVPGGWTWRFDPAFWHNFTMQEQHELLRKLPVRFSYIWGEKSSLSDPEAIAIARDLLPAGSRMLGVPDAHHHVMADQPLALVAALRALLA